MGPQRITSPETPETPAAPAIGATPAAPAATATVEPVKAPVNPAPPVNNTPSTIVKDRLDKIDAAFDESEEEKWEGSVGSDSSDDTIDVSDDDSDVDGEEQAGDADNTDDSGKYKHIFKKPAGVYSKSRALFAGLLKLEVSLWTRFLVENKEVIKIGNDHQEHYVDPRKAAATDMAHRARDVTVDTLASTIMAPENVSSFYFSAPTDEQKAEYTEADWLANSTYRMMTEMKRARFLKDTNDIELNLRYAYIGLKAREWLQNTPRRMQQAEASIAKVKEEVLQRRKAQISRAKQQRSRKPSNITSRSPAATGQTVPKADPRILSSKVPTIKKLRNPRRKATEKKEEKIDTPEALKAIESNKDGPTTVHHNAQGQKILRDSARSALEKLLKSKQPDAAGASDQPKIDLTNINDLVDLMEAEAAKYTKTDEKAVRRRQKQAEQMKMDLPKKIEALKARPGDFKAVGTLYRYISRSTKAFFTDFTEVNVAALEEKCLAPLQDVKTFALNNLDANPEDVSAVRASRLNNVVDAEDFKDQHTDAQAIAKTAEVEEVASIVQSHPDLLSTSATNNDDHDISPENLTAMSDMLPAPDRKYREMAAEWSSMINGPEYQCDKLQAAMERCYIENAKLLRVPGQSPEYVLRWWQIIMVYWAEQVLQEKKTRGGLIADAIGLGKTFEYGALMLVVSILPSAY